MIQEGYENHAVIRLEAYFPEKLSEEGKKLRTASEKFRSREKREKNDEKKEFYNRNGNESSL